MWKTEHFSWYFSLIWNSADMCLISSISRILISRILSQSESLCFSVEIASIILTATCYQMFSSVHFSHSVVSDSLQPHGVQHTRPPCPSPTPRAYSYACPLSQWCHPTISSSVVPFSSRLQSFPASGSFQMSPLHQVAKVLEFQLQHQSKAQLLISNAQLVKLKVFHSEEKNQEEPEACMLLSCCEWPRHSWPPFRLGCHWDPWNGASCCWPCWLSWWCGTLVCWYQSTMWLNVWTGCTSMSMNPFTDKTSASHFRSIRIALFKTHFLSSWWPHTPQMWKPGRPLELLRVKRSLGSLGGDMKFLHFSY